MSLDAFRQKVQRRIHEDRIAFEGIYKDEIKGLLGLSKEDIDAITPDDTTDLETYDKLITIVKEASAANLAQADLVNQIKKLGDIGVKIAKMVPGISNLL
ncbi:MAG: hypothetical protein KAR42_04670 [candidate division Zixibacteria bacterium]|nr:hypothetical protein [candidate division Zixibacteria bacterium]